jgi:hypothetical protein
MAAYGLYIALAGGCGYVLALFFVFGYANSGHLTKVRERTGLGCAALALGAVGFGGAVCLDPSLIEQFTRARDMRVLDERSKPLVFAIRRYTHDCGQPPGELRDLVPDYVDELPTTGIAWQPAFRYSVDRRDCWRLEVPVAKFMLDFESHRRFQFEPDPWLDDDLGAAARCGDWVYIPD